MAEVDVLEVLRCGSCGAAVPLVDGSTAPCMHCKTDVQVPPAHRRRHEELEQVRESRRLAEAEWRALPRPLPPWLARTLPPAFVVGLVPYLALMIIAWVFWGWFPSPLHFLGWGVFTPIFAVIFLGIDALGRRAHCRAIFVMSAVHDETGWSCRACAAVLCLQPDTLAATCDYCGADSVLTDPGPRWRAWLADEQRSAKRSLGQAIGAIQDAARERRLTTIVVAAVLLPFWLLFTGPLIYFAIVG
jgi:hypothetical protein